MLAICERGKSMYITKYFHSELFVVMYIAAGVISSCGHEQKMEAKNGKASVYMQYLHIWPLGSSTIYIKFPFYNFWSL